MFFLFFYDTGMCTVNGGMRRRSVTKFVTREVILSCVLKGKRGHALSLSFIHSFARFCFSKIIVWIELLTSWKANWNFVPKSFKSRKKKIKWKLLLPSLADNSYVYTMCCETIIASVVVASHCRIVHLSLSAGLYFWYSRTLAKCESQLVTILIFSSISLCLTFLSPPLLCSTNSGIACAR